MLVIKYPWVLMRKSGKGLNLEYRYDVILCFKTGKTVVKLVLKLEVERNI